MKLYHGTTSTFEIPDLQKARHNTDFGPGFYVTDKYALADDWLKNKPGKRINHYEVTLSHIKSCNLNIKIFEKANVEWAYLPIKILNFLDNFLDGYRQTPI